MKDNLEPNRTFAGRLHDLLNNIANVFRKVEHADAPIIAIATLSLILLSSLSAFFPNFFCYDAENKGKNFDFLFVSHEIIHMIIYISHGWCLLFATSILTVNIIGYIRDPYRVFYSTFKKKCDKPFNENISAKFDYRVATLNDNQLLAELGNEAWGTEYINEVERRELYRTWMQTRSDIFSIIYNPENNEIVGYACVIPLANNKHYFGNLRQFAITSQDISTKKSNLVYWQSLYIRPEYVEDSEAVYIGLKSVFNMALKFAIRSNGIFYAEAYTHHCGKLLRLLGFINHSNKNVDKNKIYELPFNHDLIRDTYTDGKKFLKQLRQRAEKTINIINEVYVSK